MGALKEISRLQVAHADRVDFLSVNIREAHPTDGWHFPNNPHAGEEPKDIKERQEKLQVSDTTETGRSDKCTIRQDPKSVQSDKAVGKYQVRSDKVTNPIRQYTLNQLRTRENSPSTLDNDLK